MPTVHGTAVPISQFGRTRLAFEDGVIWRRSRMPAITVQGEPADGVEAREVVEPLDRDLAAIRSRLPPGYEIMVGGSEEQSRISKASIAAEVTKMALVIMLLLMIQLQSIPRMVLVLLTAPLGTIGAAVALAATGMSFGFMALLGILALAGIIMRNSVILVDQIEQDIRSGESPGRAVVEAAVGGSDRSR